MTEPLAARIGVIADTSLQRHVLQQALSANGWNRQRTSEQLGINRTTLYKKMKAYGLLGGNEPERLAG